MKPRLKKALAEFNEAKKELYAALNETIPRGSKIEIYPNSGPIKRTAIVLGIEHVFAPYVRYIDDAEKIDSAPLHCVKETMVSEESS